MKILVRVGGVEGGGRVHHIIQMCCPWKKQSVDIKVVL